MTPTTLLLSVLVIISGCDRTETAFPTDAECKAALERAEKNRPPATIQPVWSATCTPTPRP